MIRKFLYITFANHEIATGGGQCSARNLESLQIIFGNDNVETYIITPPTSRSIKERFDRVRGVLKGYMGGLTEIHLSNILNLLSDATFTDVFIDNSQLGCIAKIITQKHKDIHIYTFFHNIEYDYMRSVIVESGDYGHSFWIYGARKNERYACKYSNSIIVLNRKDSLRVKELYDRNADAIIPISMRDDYCDLDESDMVPCSQGCMEALFIGSFFPGNTNGLKWFCNDILPDVGIHLTIAGSGMDKITKEIAESDRITIYGYLDKLCALYEGADFVVLPIISGGGMKVKTAEALQYGKFIIGTTQALEGYEINDDIATVCNSKEEFVNAINNFMRRFKYNEPSRHLFKTRHSFEISLSLYRELLKV